MNEKQLDKKLKILEEKGIIERVWDNDILDYRIKLTEKFNNL